MDRLRLLIEAYLDGELEGSLRRRVRQRLRRDPKAAAYYKQLRRMRASLRQLPTVAVPSELAQKLSPKEPLPADGADPTWHEDIVSGYLDGEISATERSRVERTWLIDPASREQLADFERASRLLRALPTEVAPPSAISFVLERVAADRAPDFLPRPALVESQTATRKPLGGLWVRASVLLAASILLAVGVWQVSQVGHRPALELARGPELSQSRPAALDERVAGPTGLEAERPGDKKTGALPREAKAEFSREETAAGLPPPLPTFARDAPTPSPPTLMKAKPAPPSAAPPLLSLAQLSALKPGDVVLLDQQQILLVCLDTDALYDRLRVVLARQRVPPLEVDVSSDKDTAKKERDRDGIYVIEVSTTGRQLTDVLQGLNLAERQKPLVAGVAISSPEPRLVADLRTLQGARATPDGQVLGQAGQAQQCLAYRMPRGIETRQRAAGQLLADAPQQQLQERLWAQTAPTPARNENQLPAPVARPSKSQEKKPAAPNAPAPAEPRSDRLYSQAENARQRRLDEVLRQKRNAGSSQGKAKEVGTVHVLLVLEPTDANPAKVDRQGTPAAPPPTR